VIADSSLRAVAAAYQTPQGVVTGIQWIPAEATSVLPQGAQPANAVRSLQPLRSPMQASFAPSKTLSSPTRSAATTSGTSKLAKRPSFVHANSYDSPKRTSIIASHTSNSPSRPSTIYSRTPSMIQTSDILHDSHEHPQEFAASWNRGYLNREDERSQKDW
jgi:hypothetical protein